MSWAIYDDLSGVEETTDGFGRHPTEQSALEGLILHLESNRSDIAAKIATAKRRLRRVKKETACA